MEALTAAWPGVAPNTCSCRRFRCSAVTGGCDGLRSCRAQASPFARRLANLRHRIEFTCGWDCSFAPGCFPPSLAATQLPFASPPFPGSVAIRVVLIGLYVVMVTRASVSYELKRLNTRAARDAPALPFFLAFNYFATDRNHTPSNSVYPYSRHGLEVGRSLLISSRIWNVTSRLKGLSSQIRNAISLRMEAISQPGNAASHKKITSPAKKSHLPGQERHLPGRCQFPTLLC